MLLGVLLLYFLLEVVLGVFMVEYWSEDEEMGLKERN